MGQLTITDEMIFLMIIEEIEIDDEMTIEEVMMIIEVITTVEEDKKG